MVKNKLKIPTSRLELPETQDMKQTWLNSCVVVILFVHRTLHRAKKKKKKKKNFQILSHSFLKKKKIVKKKF